MDDLKFFGNGFQEVIYQRALAVEMKEAGLIFKREIEQAIFYKQLPEPIGKRRADFVVEQNIGRVEGRDQIRRCAHGSGIKLSESL